jgi:hypothetical protein
VCHRQALLAGLDSTLSVSVFFHVLIPIESVECVNRIGMVCFSH